MATEKFKVWQVGWEDEVHEVEADHEDGDCPACEFIGGLPRDTPVEGLDPFVVVFEGPSGVQKTRRIEVLGRILGATTLSCANATSDDIDAARACAAEAKAGIRDHFHKGKLVDPPAAVHQGASAVDVSMPNTGLTSPTRVVPS